VTTSCSRRIREVETTTGGSSPGTVTREYVWGPGYADEIVAQLDYSADPLGGTGVTPETYYYLQDANYNVVAVVAPAAGGYPAQVLYQYTYGPYGDLNGFGDINPFVEMLAGAGGQPIPCP